MKKAVVVLVVILILVLFWWWLRDDGGEGTFSGTLRDPSGQPVAGAKISVGGNTVVTDEEGRFVIKGRWVIRDRWVLEARRPGYAPISKVFNQGSEDTNLTAVRTTKQTFDASAVIVARDTRTTCVGSVAASVDWGPYPTARFPQVLDAGGNVVTSGLPETARRALDFLSSTPPCNTGFQVSIPAGGLMTRSGQPAQGQVTVELSTVDLYSPDGMPGDYTVRAGAEGPAFMESLGAGTIEVRAGDEELQLSEGTKAEILIPVDPAQIGAGSKIPKSIPLLRYDPDTGQWIEIGVAKLDERRQVYVGEVEHFTEFNADVVKTNPACVSFNASGISGSFDLVTTAPTTSGGFKVVTHNVQANASQAQPNLHALYNLPPNDWVIMRAIRAGTPIGTWVVATGGPWGGTGAPPYLYSDCGTAYNLSETVGTGVSFSGTGRRFGELLKHVSFMVNTSGASEDVYPVGGTDCSGPCSYFFSLFDTGAHKVVVDSVLYPFLGLSIPTDANWDVDVRINSLSSLPAGSNPASSFGVPGTAGGAAANSGVIRLAPSSLQFLEEEVATDTTGNPVGGIVQVNYMLVGAPMLNKILARIDYTTDVTRGPWTFAAPFTITSPDIQFYRPGASGIPAPNLTLFGQGFGAVHTVPTGTSDQRPFLQNVTFTNTVGATTNNVFDNQSTSNPVRFLYDTGTTFTVISSAMATTLGAMPASPNPAARCSSLNQANFVTLDLITVVGMNAGNQLARYEVNNPEVCVDVANTVIIVDYTDPANPTGPKKKVDAVIGANLFDQAKILWDGPKLTIGILP